MVAFVTAFLLLIAGTALVFAVGMRRPAGKPVTWAEAILGALAVFGLMLLAYGVVPDRWLIMEQNQWGWRKDSIAYVLRFWGRGQIVITKEAVGDIVVTMLYVVFLGAHISLWSLWQKRGQTKEQPALETSTFGRPLVRKV